MDEEKFMIVQKKLREAYALQRKDHLSKKIVLVKNNEVFPKKSKKIKKILNTIDLYFLKDIMREDYIRYVNSVKNCDMTTIKELSKKYKIDLGRLNGYEVYICDTEDDYMYHLVEKVFTLY